MLLQIISRLKMNSSRVASEHNRTSFPRGIMFFPRIYNLGIYPQNTCLRICTRSPKDTTEGMKHCCFRQPVHLAQLYRLHGAICSVPLLPLFVLTGIWVLWVVKHWILPWYLLKLLRSGERWKAFPDHFWVEFRSWWHACYHGVS